MQKHKPKLFFLGEKSVKITLKELCHIDRLEEEPLRERIIRIVHKLIPGQLPPFKIIAITQTATLQVSVVLETKSKILDYPHGK